MGRIIVSDTRVSNPDARPAVHAELRPVPSASALAWVGYARGIVAEIAATGGRLPDAPDTSVPAEVLEAFSGYLDEWERVARAGPVFRWSGEADAETVEYLVHALYNLARGLAERAERRGVSAMPPEGLDFYDALVVGLLDALAEEGPEPARAFAEELREFWPGLELEQ
jgi:hypothetical protein